MKMSAGATWPSRSSIAAAVATCVLVAQSSCAGSRFRLTPAQPTINDNGATSSRIVQSVGPQRLRVLSFNLGDIRLGQCATPDGGLLQRICLRRESYGATSTYQPIVEIDYAVRNDLNVGTFRQYSQRVDTSGGATFDFPSIANVSAAGSQARYLLVFEWRRYRYQSLYKHRSERGQYERSYELEENSPAVTAVETGIAVRIAFDVRLRSVDASASASFGFGNMAAALANQLVDVQVGYEVIGITRDILPRNPVNISSVDGYVAAMSDFYAAVRSISDEWNNYVAAQPRTEADAGSATDAGAPNSFQLGVLAFYVSGSTALGEGTLPAFNRGYAEGLRRAAAGSSCAAALRAFGQTPAAQPDGGADASTQLDVDFEAGIRAAYNFLNQESLRSPGCSERPPTDEQQRDANVELRRMSASVQQR